ncbi:unnamed protein product [Notodromas monacha]|uniref:Uncharacterized protein n=1 Tax=Notodromas monacha TaxID=399045 RepID=A0A7R9GIK7_9CRUS|nr:unnamed protein product [Notodromas monacha]CAG0923937.1 unnamed protein product [Notodromas monacha]
MFGKYFWATSLVLPFAVFGQRPFEGCQTADVCSNVKCFDPDDPEVTCDGIVMPDFDYPCKCCPVTCIKYLSEYAEIRKERNVFVHGPRHRMKFAGPA